MHTLFNTCIQAGLRDHLHFTIAVGSFVMHYSRCEAITSQKTKQIYFIFRLQYVLCLLWCVMPCCLVNKYQCVRRTCIFYLHGFMVHSLYVYPYLGPIMDVNMKCTTWMIFLKLYKDTLYNLFHYSYTVTWHYDLYADMLTIKKLHFLNKTFAAYLVPVHIMASTCTCI